MKVIAMYFKELWYEDVGCIQLAQDRIQWQAVVNMVMNFRDPWNARSILTSSSYQISAIKLVIAWWNRTFVGMRDLLWVDLKTQARDLFWGGLSRSSLVDDQRINPTEQSPSWKADSYHNKFSDFFWTPKVHYRLHASTRGKELHSCKFASCLSLFWALRLAVTRTVIS
jgi:hypothetical protein